MKTATEFLEEKKVFRIWDISVFPLVVSAADSKKIYQVGWRAVLRNQILKINKFMCYWLKIYENSMWSKIIPNRTSRVRNTLSTQNSESQIAVYSFLILDTFESDFMSCCRLTTNKLCLAWTYYSRFVFETSMLRVLYTSTRAKSVHGEEVLRLIEKC